MINMKLRLEIYKAKEVNKIYQYEIAEKLGISRFKLNRLLQREISKDTEQKIFKALDELKTEKAQPVEL